MAPSRKSERDRDPRKPVIEPAAVTDPPAAPTLIRAGLPLSVDAEPEILWDRFQNESRRNQMRGVVKREAIKMGMIEKPADGSSATDNDTMTVQDLCDLVSVFLQAAAVQTIPNMTADDLPRVTVQPHHVAMMNRRGCGDRVLAKWMPKVPIKDEISFGTGVLMAGASIIGAFRTLRDEKLAAQSHETTRPVENRPPARGPVAVMTMPGVADAMMGS